MKKFYQFYLIFCIFTLLEIIAAIIYIRMSIKEVKGKGILVYPALIYASVGYFLGNFFTFTSLSFAVIAQNYNALIFYFYLSCNIILSSFCYAPFSYRSYLYLTFLMPQILEVLFVFYNFNLYARKILFLRNRKIGSDIRLKKY